MQRKLDALREDLSWFVDQDEHMVLVLDTVDDELAYVLKILQMVEGEHVSDVFLMFAHEFDDATGFVDAMMDNIEIQRTAVNELRAEDELSPWPALPASCRDPAVEPSRRIIAAVEWLRTQLPAPENHVILGLLPTRLTNPVAYSELLAGLLPRAGIEPWMNGLRVLVRDDRHRPFLIPAMERNPNDWVLFYDRLDLSPAALTQALVEDAGDPDVPEGQRMVALVQLAALDFSHRRYAESYRKWGILFDYYRRMEAPTMQAMALCGAADVLRATGKLADAKARYQQGLAIAQSAETLPAALNLLLGIGEACIGLEHWPEASGYLELADEIASKTMQIYAKCDVMERHGIALLAMGDDEAAETKWRAAVDLSREVRHDHRAASILGLLIALAEERGRPEDKVARERELAELDKGRAQ